MVDQATLEHMTRNEADMAFKKRVRTIFEWIDPQDSDIILDCACGRGFYLNMFRYVSQCKLVGLELDWPVIEKAKGNVGHLSNLMLNNANIYTLPYADNTFDGVILSGILEHIDRDVDGLREVYRVLKPGGVMAITVPNANYPFWWDPINKSLETVFHTHISKGPLAGIWANHVRLYTACFSVTIRYSRQNSEPPALACALFRCSGGHFGRVRRCERIVEPGEGIRRFLRGPHRGFSEPGNPAVNRIASSDCLEP